MYYHSLMDRETVLLDKPNSDFFFFFFFYCTPNQKPFCNLVTEYSCHLFYIFFFWNCTKLKALDNTGCTVPTNCCEIGQIPVKNRIIASKSIKNVYPSKREQWGISCFSGNLLNWKNYLHFKLTSIFDRNQEKLFISIKSDVEQLT